MVSKFFRFSIKGDNINPEEIRDAVSLPCDIYRKDDVVVKQYLTQVCLKQKTNRWVYYDEAHRGSRLDGFLTKNLLLIDSKLPLLKPWIKNAECQMELVIYAGDNTDIKLNCKHVELINKIGVGISISFC